MKQSFKLFFRTASTNRCVSFGQQQPADTRRVPVPVPPPSWDQFLDLLQFLFGSKFHPELCIQYKDDEGEFVRVTSQIEWEEALDVSKDERIVKIFVTDTGRPYFKDSPAPEPRCLYAQNSTTGEQQEIQTSKKQLGDVAQQVTDCLSKLFQGGKILPYNLPDWLKGAVRVRSLGDDVDIDVDIDQLKTILFDKGLQFLNEGLLQKGKDAFEALLELNQNRPIVLYNLACAESLLGHTEVALKRLHEAIDNGYSNLNHLLTDSDLDNIKLLPAFEAIYSKLREISKPAELHQEEQKEISHEEQKEQKEQEQEEEEEEQKEQQEEEEQKEQKEEEEQEEESEEEEEEEEQSEEEESEEEEEVELEESNQISLEPSPAQENSNPFVGETPQPQEEDHYAHQKALLREMGFETIDEEFLQLALIYANGDLSVAISHLLEFSPDV